MTPLSSASADFAQALELSALQAIERDYVPIGDYGLIGDCHGAALVARDGSIDWCCLERFDAPPVFSRLLDKRHGGWFQIRPHERARATRRYLGESNLLETTFETAHGAAVVVDFMPVRRDEVARHDEHFPSLHGAVVRIVRGVRGRVSMHACYRPRAGFDSEAPTLSASDNKVRTPDCPTLHADIQLSADPHEAHADFEIAASESHCFILAPAAWRSDAHEPAAPQELRGFAERLCKEAGDFWEHWGAQACYNGPHRDVVMRSALVLKLLTYTPTGAIVAAPTTSLPEEIGGVRNWDYRFCWPRDASFALYSLRKLGYATEGERFFDYLMEAARARLPRLLPLYGIEGETNLQEYEIGHFEGYRGSRPVRCGNEAVDQHQLDVYGQLLDLIYLHRRMDGALSEEHARIAATLADYVAEHWREPDAGIWEPRRSDRRHVHSAIMAWVALDRAVRLYGERDHWCSARDALLADIRAGAVHPQGGYLTQVFGSEETDAAVLIGAVVGLPVGDAVLSKTIDRVIEELGAGPLVYRYRTDDGLPGEEGTFLVCACWLIDALLAVDRYEEALERFDQLCELGNDLGLYSEEMAEDGTFLGNFPQALTHLGILHAALMLELYREGGVDAVRGTYADRAERRGLEECRR